MRNVLVDNWLIENIVLGHNSQDMEYNLSYSNLLMALLLWDNVYYPKSKYNWWKTESDDCFDSLFPYDDEEQKWSFEAYRHIYGNRLTEDDYEWIVNKVDNFSEEERIEHGAYRYMLLCRSNGFDYLPCPKRQDFFRRKNMDEMLTVLQEHFNMEKIIIDEIKKQIGLIYSDLEVPILTRYILKNTPKGSNPLQYALFLKNEGPIVEYREYLNIIKTEYSLGNYEKASKLINHSHRIVKNVIKINPTNIISTRFEIFPLILLLLGLNKTQTSLLSTAINFNLDIGMLLNSNIAFLKDLTKFAISDRFVS